MKYVQVLIFFYLPFATSFTLAQSGPLPRRAMNNAFVEWRGVTGHYSVNYERRLLREWNNRVLLSAGTGFSSFTYSVSKWTMIPLRLNVAVGCSQFYGELGVDYLFAHENYKSWRLGSIWERHRFVRYGLRYQSLKRGLFVRAYVFPITVDATKDAYLYHLGYNYSKLKKTQKRVWWGGIGVGYSF